VRGAPLLLSTQNRTRLMRTVLWSGALPLLRPFIKSVASPWFGYSVRRFFQGVVVDGTVIGWLRADAEQGDDAFSAELFIALYACELQSNVEPELDDAEEWALEKRESAEEGGEAEGEEGEEGEEGDEEGDGEGDEGRWRRQRDP